MPDMLVRLIDKYTGPDATMQAKTTARGDVILTTQTGHQWSQRERTSYQWLIMATDAPMEKCTAMSVPEGNSPNSRIRPFHFNLEFLIAQGTQIPTRQQAEAGFAANNTRPVASVFITEALFDQAKTGKPPLPDTAVIG